MACLSDLDCGVGTCDEAGHNCALLPDSCATAQLIPLGDAPFTIRGNTSKASDDTVLSCALPGTQGRDLVYRFELDRPRRLSASAVGLSAGVRPVLALRRDCAGLDPADTHGCAFAGVGATAHLTADLQPGSWFLWVDDEGASGAFELTAELGDLGAADSCSLPRPLVFNGTRAEATGDTRGGSDDNSGSCTAMGAPDRVYAFRLDRPYRVRVEVEPRLGTYSPALYLRGDVCTDESPEAQLGCAGAGPGGRAALELPRLLAGTYHVFVDGRGEGPAAAGSFRLSVTLLDATPIPVNDSCVGATPLALPSSGLGAVTVQADTTLAYGDAYGCGGTGKDLVYALDLPGPRKVTARVSPSPGSTLRPSLYLRSRCELEAAAHQLGCAQAQTYGSATSLVVPSLPAGRYFLWVDGVSASSGAFELVVDVQAAPPAPPNDTCANALVLPIASGVATIAGTTVSAVDDVGLLCTAPLGGYSPDVVYALDLPVPQAVAIDVSPATGSTLRPTFALRPASQCLNPFDDPSRCAFDDLGVRRTVLSVPELAAGRWYLWVEGDDATQGSFAVRVVTSPPVAVPPNDDCSGSSVPTLSLGLPLAGDTRAAANDALGHCALADGLNGEAGRDVAYRFSVAQTQTVKLTVTPDPGTGALFRPVVYVQPSGTCGGALVAPLGCGVATDFGQPVSLQLTNVAAGTYLVWVDGAGLSSGSFGIRLQ